MKGILFFIFFAILIMPCAAQQSGIKTPLSAVDVIDETTQPAPPQEQARINEKSRRYDRPLMVGNPRWNGDLTLRSDLIRSGGARETGEANSPLPIAADTVIVIGIVTHAQPYLSQSKTVLFTDFNFKVDKLLKVNAFPILSGMEINMDSDGGVLRLQDGRIIRYGSSDGILLPRLNHRYVLFLKPVDNRQSFSLINGYEVRENKVFPLQESYIFTPGTGTITKQSPFANMDLAEFVQIITKAISDFSLLQK